MVLNGFPMVSHGFRMVLHGFLWLFNTFRMVFVWLFEWFSYGSLCFPMVSRSRHGPR